MKLPKFLYNRIKNKTTFLDDNPALPCNGEMSFIYDVIKQGLCDSVENAKNIFGQKPITVDEVKNKLSILIQECTKIESKFKSQLERLCRDTVVDIFQVPQGIVNIDCILTSKISPHKNFRLTPENMNCGTFKFKNTNQSQSFRKAVLKRRIINTLILGGSQIYAQKLIKSDAFINIDPKLPKLYEKIFALNTFLLYNSKEDISDKHPRQGACVEVYLGRHDETSTISAQGIIYPFLLQETIRGFLELFASHGLPRDNSKADLIIKQSDFLLSEPWDLRFGLQLWPILTRNCKSTAMLPYFFTLVCSMKSNKFNTYMREILSRTYDGDMYISRLMAQAQRYYNNSHIDQVKCSPHKDIIEDEYLTINEIDDLNDNDDGEDIYRLIRNCKYYDIDFIDEQIDMGISIARPLWQLHVKINGIEIPTDLVNLKAELVNFGDENGYQLHIYIDPIIRNVGLGTKIYRQFINLYGKLISLFSNEKISALKDLHADITPNDYGIYKIWQKLDTFSEIDVFVIHNMDGEAIGFEATLN